MDDLTELYGVMDDFCKEFEPALKARMIAEGKRRRARPTGLSVAELMTLMVLFHQGSVRKSCWCPTLWPANAGFRGHRVNVRPPRSDLVFSGPR